MHGLRIARIRGIELHAHWSLLVIIALVATSFATGEIPLEYPRWSSVAAWSAGVGVALGLVVSIALHELAHSIIAQRVGVRVPQITLFALGGIAQLGTRPSRASHEFAITIAGPVTSFLLGAALLAASTVGEISASASPGAVAALVALALGQLNVALAVFNCLPGAPLDGGRVLHSIIWRTTGSEARATTISTRAGQVFGSTFVAVGVLMLFGLDVPWFGTGAGGAWLILIGWFIAIYARAERMAMAVAEVASGTSISDITHVASLLDVPHSDMTPSDEAPSIGADSTIADAMQVFAEHDVRQLSVIDGARVIGFVHRDDLDSWLRLHARRTDEGGTRMTGR